jgi:flagellar basal-body rod protein FlgF
MISGMYASAAGMLTGIARQDLYAGNLANSDTVGYRRLGCGTKSFALALRSVSAGGEQLRGGAGPVDEVLDLAEGALETTGNRLDLAINGPGFLAVQTPQGIRYTRDGRLRVNAAGLLADARGNVVMGVNGAIQIGNAGETPAPHGTGAAGETPAPRPGAPPGIEVSETGQVKSGGRFVGELLIADLPAASLKPAGGNLYTSSATPQRSVTARIVQGSLEGSNASAVRELGAMMRNSRYYEANAAALRQQDQTLEGLVRLVGE